MLSRSVPLPFPGPFLFHLIDAPCPTMHAPRGANLLPLYKVKQDLMYCRVALRKKKSPIKLQIILGSSINDGKCHNLPPQPYSPSHQCSIFLFFLSKNTCCTSHLLQNSFLFAAICGDPCQTRAIIEPQRTGNGQDGGECKCCQYGEDAPLTMMMHCKCNHRALGKGVKKLK